jgi:tetratricopeptide (TPR) repeat protein
MHADLYPHDFQARQVLLALLTQEGQYDSATVQLEAMYALDTTRSEVLLQLGRMTAQQGQHDRALQHFRRYAARFPEDPDSYEAVALALSLLGSHDQALEQYDRALLLDPEAVDALLGSGRVLLDIGRFDEARMRLDQALRAAGTPSERADVYRMFQYYHDRRGELSQAVDYMEQSWAEGGATAVPFVQLQLKLESLGQYVRAGRVDIARDSLRALTAQLSPPFDALLGLGRLAVAVDLENADSIEAALSQVDTLITRFGVGALHGDRERAMGFALELRGECDRAMPRYRRALELQPMLRDASLGLARCERTTGDLDRAKSRLEDLLRQRPYHPITLYEYALVLADQGKRDDAVRELHKAMQVFENAEPTCLWANRVKEAVGRLGG